MGKVLVVDDDPALHQVIEGALVREGHALLHATGGRKGLELLERENIDLVVIDYAMPEMDGLEFLEQARNRQSELKAIMITAFGTPEAVLGALRQKVCDFLVKPFGVADIRAAVRAVINEQSLPEIEVISAEPHWVQLRVPCDLAAVPILQKLLTQLKTGLPDDTREAIAYAFREMLNNAIEHGGKLDPTKYVEVLCVMLKRAIIYWIKDPGEGFDPSALEHAAVNNPAGDPFRHVSVRDEKGLRAGGFGILMADQLVDELVYNERRNEVMFIKYL
ncbi:MAG TPA: response regulator [Blastocatellia bacterium]|nr:response regulator [Blastocatellia bacterium]